MANLMMDAGPTTESGATKAPERSVKWYQDQIRLGVQYQQMYGRSGDWARFRGYYRHQWPSKGRVLPVNVIFSQVRSLIPQVYPRDPRVYVTARQPGMEAKARIVEAIDNWLIGQLDFKNQIKKMVLDAALTGSACAYVGYDSEYGFNFKDLGLDGTSTLSMLDKNGYKTEYSSFVNPGMPWFLRAEPENTVFPWGTKDPNNSEMLFTKCIRPLRDFKADGKYSHTDKVTGSYTGTGSDATVGTDFYSRMHEMQEMVEFWQIRDFKTKEILVVTMQCDQFHRKEQDELQIAGSMMHWLTFNEDPQLPWGIPDARIIEPQQLELNETRTLSMKHRRVALLKILYKQGAMNPTELDKLFDEEVKCGIAVNAETRLADAVMSFQTQVPEDLNTWGDVVRDDIREMIGFSRNQAGQFQGKSHISATETGTVSQANSIRINERQDAVADLMTRVICNINEVIFKFWNTPRVQKIVGPIGAQAWVQYTGEELKGDYDVKINMAEGPGVDGNSRRQQAAELLTAWTNITGGQMAVPGELARYVFSNYEGINTDAIMAQLAQLGIIEQTLGTQQKPISMQQFDQQSAQINQMVAATKMGQGQSGTGGQTTPSAKSEGSGSDA